jgi:tetratricopeptide (TPR) repeat protein
MTSDAAETSPLLDAPPVAPAATDLQAQKDRRFRELRQQIDELSRRWPGPAGSQPAPAPAHEPAASAHAPPPAALEPMPIASPTGHGARPVKPEPTAVPVTAPHEPAHGAESEPAQEEHWDSRPTDAKSSMPLEVTGLIDRFALALSLFGAGQADVCLDVLNRTDLKSLPRADQVWAEYLKACCYRRLGNIADAQRQYRKVLAEDDADWLADLSRWWLDNLDQKAKLKADSQRLTETLAAWEKEIESLRQSPN